MFRVGQPHGAKGGSQSVARASSSPIVSPTMPACTSSDEKVLRGSPAKRVITRLKISAARGSFGGSSPSELQKLFPASSGSRSPTCSISKNVVTRRSASSNASSGIYGSPGSVIAASSHQTPTSGRTTAPPPSIRAIATFALVRRSSSFNSRATHAVDGAGADFGDRAHPRRPGPSSGSATRNQCHSSGNGESGRTSRNRMCSAVQGMSRSLNDTTTGATR
jgi:hypothetical protein